MWAWPHACKVKMSIIWKNVVTDGKNLLKAVVIEHSIIFTCIISFP